MEVFVKVVIDKKSFTVFVKTSIWEVLQGSENASELAFILKAI